MSGTITIEEPLHDRGETVFVVTLVMNILATLFTGCRMWSKWGVVKKVNADDWLVVLAWVFCTGLSIAIMVGAKHGLGAPDSQILPEWAATLKHSTYAFTTLYNPSLMATKSAILLLYLRLSAAHPILKYASYATLLIVNLAGIVLTFLNVFQCRPVVAAFTLNREGSCIDLVSLYLSSAPINIITDLAILFLPLPILTGLRMEWRQKVILITTFIIGGFVTIVDIVRVAYLQNALKVEVANDPTADSTVSATKPLKDFTYHASFSLMWSAVEVNVGLICACVLVLKPLVMKVLPSLLGRRRRSMGEILSGRRVSMGVVEGVERERKVSTSVSDTSKEPRSPRQPLQAILEDSPVLDHDSHTSNDPLAPPPTQTQTQNMISEDEDEDGDMDFFQMLNSGPSPTDPVQSSPPQSFPAMFPSLTRHTTTFRSGAAFQPGNTPKSGFTETFGASQEPTQTFFDFVNMGSRKGLTELTEREAWWPVLFVSVLFFLWGFAYGLLGTLNGEIQSLLGYSPSRTIALHNAYWIAYFIGPPVLAYYPLKHSSQPYKPLFILGLCLYSCGALSFWPSSVLRSYPGFFISNFLVALGLSLLEVAANPYIALAGPPHLSEARLNFSQGIQAIGSVVSPILADKALFAEVNGARLFKVQWCYLAVALFVVALAVVFYYAPIPETTDSALEASSTQQLYNVNLEPKSRDPITRLPIRSTLLWSGAILMSTYVGAQESVSYFWGPLSRSITPNRDPFWNQAIAHAVFALGRFLASFGCWLGIQPRYILLYHLVGAFVTSLLTLLLPNGAPSLVMLILLVYFESAIFPTLFAMVLRGQGGKTRLASIVLTSAISGGAVWPSVVYGVNDMGVGRGARVQNGLKVTVGLYAVAMLWPAWVCPSRRIRRWVDPQRVGVAGEGEGVNDGQVEGEGRLSGLEGKGRVDHVEGNGNGG